MSVPDEVGRELVAAAPLAWRTLQTAPRRWEVHPTGEVARTAPKVCFHVELTPDDRWVLVFHGNTDAGAVTPARLLLQCTAVSTDTLRLPVAALGLRACLADIFARREPDRYGLT